MSVLLMSDAVRIVMEVVIERVNQSADEINSWNDRPDRSFKSKAYSIPWF